MVEEGVFKCQVPGIKRQVSSFKIAASVHSPVAFNASSISALLTRKP